MRDEFNNIFDVLDECLDRMLVNGDTVEQCLQDYPEQTDELKPLLEAALVAQEISTIQPRPEFKARARYEFRSAIYEMTERKSRPAVGWFPRVSTVLATFAAVLLMGGSTVIAANYSMPDSPLYQVKLTTEQMQLMLTPSDIDKANLCASFSDRRVTEIIYMANKGDAQQVELVTAHLDENLDLLASLATATKEGTNDDRALLTLAPSAESATTQETEEGAAYDTSASGKSTDGEEWTEESELQETVKNGAESATDALRLALDEVPDSAKPALRQSIAVSVAGYNKALNALE